MFSGGIKRKHWPLVSLFVFACKNKKSTLKLQVLNKFWLCKWKCLQKQPSELLCKKHVVKNFSKFTGKHLCWSFLFNKIAGLRCFWTLLIKILRHRCFPVNFAKFLRAPFLLNSSGKLLLWLILIYGIENNRGNISLKPWKLLMKYVVSLHYCKTDTGKDFITPKLYTGKVFHISFWW